MSFRFNPLFGTGLTPTGGSSSGGILADGTVPFTGDQSMGGNQLTNVGTPIAGTDAATKNYVDGKILAFTSAATVGGAVQETVAVTGLLTSDTVLAVTQKTMGSATRTSLPLIQWNVGSNGNITLDWVADPGTGAVVIVSVKR